jgi:hypothetical protein
MDSGTWLYIEPTYPIRKAYEDSGVFLYSIRFAGRSLPTKRGVMGWTKANGHWKEWKHRARSWLVQFRGSHEDQAEEKSPGWSKECS